MLAKYSYAHEDVAYSEHECSKFWCFIVSWVDVLLQKTVLQVIQNVRRYGIPTYHSCTETWLLEHWVEINCRRPAGYCFMQSVLNTGSAEIAGREITLV